MDECDNCKDYGNNRNEKNEENIDADDDYYKEKDMLQWTFKILLITYVLIQFEKRNYSL